VFDRPDEGWEKSVRISEALPGFYLELERALQVQGLTSLLEQLPQLEILDRCACEESGCATFRVSPSRELNVVEANVIGVRHGTSTPIDLAGLVVVDTDTFGRATTLEILNRPDLAGALSELGVPRKGGRTTR